MAYLIALLPTILCPLVMGLLMWLMMRQQPTNQPSEHQSSQRSISNATRAGSRRNVPDAPGTVILSDAAALLELESARWSRPRWCGNLDRRTPSCLVHTAIPPHRGLPPLDALDDARHAGKPVCYLIRQQAGSSHHVV